MRKIDNITREELIRELTAMQRNMRRMNILVLEDTQSDYEALCEMLKDITPESTIIGPIRSVEEGRRFFNDVLPTMDDDTQLLIIADVQLEDGVSFYALSEAPADVPIIFTTAYDGYALRAFEFNSLSYMLKPIEKEPLRQAIRKSQERLVSNRHREELFRLLAKRAKYRERFLVSTYNGEKVVHVKEIRYIMSEQKTTYIFSHDGTSHAIDMTLKDMAEQLNPQRFMRVNRKFIIPITEVQHFEQLQNGRERLVIKGPDSPEIDISRENKHNVHRWIE